ncbi:hypothetical protein LCGC14_2544880, partial [marine sediment metagenome]
IKAGIILSTCNRIEVYAQITRGNFGQQKTLPFESLKKFLGDYHSIENGGLDSYLYRFTNREAIHHLFRVASGLDSQVLGETQILGQVRSAYSLALEAGTTDWFLDRLFEKAIEVGKRVRRKTEISRGSVSIGSVALRMLERELGNLEGKKILIIGVGKIGELVTKYLLDKGIDSVIVSNRTYEKAVSLAQRIGGKAIRFDGLKAELKKVEVIISATASPHLILRKMDILEAVRERINPLFIIDLALPRDIDPRIKEIRGVTLYDLDDLKGVIEENYRRRKEEARLAEVIVRKEVQKFLDPSKEREWEERPLELALEVAP